MIKTFTNNEIYMHMQQLFGEFGDNEQKLPIKINFPLQKNKATLRELAQEIERERMKIAETYGTLDEDGIRFNIPEESYEQVNKELSDLLSVTQDVNIMTIKYSMLDEDLVLSAGQMDALMFMIEE